MQAIPILLVYLVFILISISKGKQKKQNASGAGKPGAGRPAAAGPAAPAKRLDPALEAWLDQGAPAQSDSVPAKPAQEPQVGSLTGYTPQGVDPCHDDYAAMPTGSLRVEHGEGEDPCHDDWRPVVPSGQGLTEEKAPEGGLRLNWTGDEMVKGFVYGEILRKRA